VTIAQPFAAGKFAVIGSGRAAPSDLVGRRVPLPLMTDA
jgi:hypothetical protein